MKNRRKYSPDWLDTIRPGILKRDNYKCVTCGVRHRAIGYYDPQGLFVEADPFIQLWALRQGLKVMTIYLQIIHRDQNPANNNWDNLSAMCPKDHFRFDNAHNTLKRLAK